MPKGSGGRTGSPKRQTTLSSDLTSTSEATAEEGDPLYEREKEPEPWPQMEDKEGIQRDARHSGNGGWGMHFRNPDRPLRQVHELDFRRVADHLRTRHGLEFSEIKQTSHVTVQMNFSTAQNGKRGCVQVYMTKLGQGKGNARLCVGDPERLKELRSIFLKSAWFTDATNALIGEGCGQEPKKEKDTDKMRDRLAELDFASEDVEFTQKHIAWLAKFPEHEFKPEEIRLRAAIFEFITKWEGDSEPTLGDLVTDSGVLHKMHFMPKRFPLEAWVDRRIGTEMIFKDVDGTRLGMVCELIEGNEELLVPTVTP